MDTARPFSAAVLCILVAFARSQTAAESELKPHYLYMKRLREQISDSQFTIPDNRERNESMDGKLVATSMETQSTEGRGIAL
jgi:hypothetical protein